jgi:hypothetical protein
METLVREVIGSLEVGDLVQIKTEQGELNAVVVEKNSAGLTLFRPSFEGMLHGFLFYPINEQIDLIIFAVRSEAISAETGGVFKEEELVECVLSDGGATAGYKIQARIKAAFAGFLVCEIVNSGGRITGPWIMFKKVE